MSAAPSAPLRFTKMHGAGNDFVILDSRHAPAPPAPGLIARLADRHRGVGCDQLLTIELPRSVGAALAYGIWNADGSTAAQCGNGARCVVAWAHRAGLIGRGEFLLDSPSGPVRALLGTDGSVAVELGEPGFDPAAVPLAVAAPADQYPFAFEGHSYAFAAVSIGNPHAVLQVDDVASAPVAALGAALQADPRFPQSCNVGFAEVVARDRIRLRVVERGVGETLACGSGACAAVAVLRRADLVDAGVAVMLPGGTLDIHWPGPGAPVRMAGPAEFVFEGEWPT